MEPALTYAFHTTPFDHQLRVFNETWNLPAYAILWEQGTGKTKLAIDTACALWEAGEIDAVVVVAPNGVHRNWVTDELPVHAPPRLGTAISATFYQTQRANTKWHEAELERLIKHRGFAWLMMSFDAVMTERGRNYLWRFLRKRRCLYIVDEGHNIKGAGTKRTKRVVASGRYAPYRRLLTGTPVATGPFDIYSQVKFVDENIWRDHELDDYWSFKQYFGEWMTAAEFREINGWDPGYDKLLGYKNLERLSEILASCSSRVTKDEVLDLPPKLYSKRYYTLNPEQARVYEQLRDEFLAELEDGTLVDGNLAIVRLLRLQQICCGYAQGEDPEEPVRLLGKSNPLLETVLEECEATYHPGIIWARFTKDIDQLMDALGRSAVRYDGTLDDDQAARNKAAFQAGDAQWFVGNAQKGGSGLTLVQARRTLYYSNSFKLIERLQSEDRNHRIGQEHPVDYTDFEARLPDGRPTVTRQIISSLRDKYDIAAQITGDELKDWLS